MLKVILNRLKPQAEEILAEEQAEKYHRTDLQHQSSVWEIQPTPARHPKKKKKKKSVQQGVAWCIMGRDEQNTTWTRSWLAANTIKQLQQKPAVQYLYEAQWTTGSLHQ